MENSWRLSDILTASVSPAETASRNSPDGVAIEAAIVLIIVLLQALGGAFRATKTALPSLRA